MVSLALLASSSAFASEADIPLPQFSLVTLGGMPGTTLLGGGLAIALVGLVIGFVMFMQVKALPVHKAMLEISELIYATCFTYVVTQAKFIAKLWIMIAVVVVAYFGVLAPVGPVNVVIILIYSLIGIAGSIAIAAFGMRMNN